MAPAASKKDPVWSTLARAALAVVLALAPTHAYGLSQPESEPDPDAALVYEERDAYVDARLDESLAPAEGASPLAFFASLVGFDMNTLADSGHTLYLKHTIYDAAAAGADQSLDAIYARDDWMTVIAGQYGSSADLLDPGPQSDYYVAMAATSIQNGLGAPTDHVFAAMTNDGDVLDGGTYDYATGLAYLPKALYHRDGEDIPFACQLQLLIPAHVQDSQTCRTDVSVDCHDLRIHAAATQTIESHAFDVTTSIPVTDAETAGYLTLDDIHVRLNGSDEELELIAGQTAQWDSATGVLEINASPQTVLRADVTTDAPSLLELLSEPAQATATSSLAYVPEVVFDRLNMETLTPGRALPFNTNIDYWWANPHPNDFMWHACVSTGSYCYSWINDPSSLYEYIAWSNGADWNGVSAQDVSNFFVDPNANQASRNYFNYVFLFGDWTIEDQCFHSEAWPVNNPYDGGWGTTHFGLQCSHAKNPVGNGVSTVDGAGSMMLRILDVNTEAARPYVVLGFVGPSVANQPGVGIYKFEILPAGNIEVQKSSALPEMSMNNANYQFNGIAYDVFADAACTDLVCTMSLDESGRGTSKHLKEGSYFVRENATSTLGHGYAYDTTVHPVAVCVGKTSTLSVRDLPQSYKVDALLRKCDSVTANSTPQGDAALEDATFEVKHYRELFGDVRAAASFTPARTWRFATDSGGTIRLDADHLTGGGALYCTDSGEPRLPLGTLTIREVEAPRGYRTDATVHVIPLGASGTSESITFTSVTTVSEDVMRGGVLIEKRDAESGLTGPLGAASLDGTTFEIRNASQHAVCVDGVMHEPGKIVRRITAEGGSASTEADALPFGTYEIQEISAGTGYLASDTTVRTFPIECDGAIVRLDQGRACYDQVKRGDLDFRKVFEGDQSRLARIPFILESQTTGEKHVLVTDDNGIVNTSATWHAHTQATNVNDWIMDAGDPASSPIPSAALDTDAGLWFGLTPTGDMTAPDDALGALPYDTYGLIELRSDSNEGLDLVRIDGIRVAAHGISVPLGDVEDRLTPPPAISTYAKSSADSSKHVFPNRNARITDRIDYCNLNPGVEYVFAGRLMDAATGEAITDAEGSPITTSLALTPPASSGSCEVAFEFDAWACKGKRLVCFETVSLAASGEVVARHEELTDQGQSVDVIEPQINTYATDAATDTKEITSAGVVTIVDAVSYSGLEEGAEYTLHGQLMRKVGAPSALCAEPVLDESGDELICTVAFTPLSQTGNTSVSFAFDPSGVADKTEFVVYETLSRDGRDLVIHKSPDNAAQTIVLAAPHITTHAFEKESGLNTAHPAADLVITDEVSYENVSCDATYTLFGTVMVATADHSGHVSAEPLLDAAGNKVCASMPLAPQSPSGSVFLDLHLDASALGGKRLVIYERLVCEGRVVATHEIADAESQTIWIEGAPTKQPRTLTALPQTGDGTTSLPVLVVLSSAGALAACGMLIARRRERHEPRTCASRTQGRN